MTDTSFLAILENGAPLADSPLMPFCKILSLEDALRNPIPSIFTAILVEERLLSESHPGSLATLQRLYPGIPIVLLTTDSNPDCIAQAYEQGVDAILPAISMNTESQISVVRSAALRKSRELTLEKSLEEARSDVTLHHAAYRKCLDRLKDTGKVMEAMSECSRLPLIESDTRTYTRAFCRTLVKKMPLRMAWVGLAGQRNDSGFSLHELAHAGHEEGYLQFLRESEWPGFLPCSAIGMALETGLPQTVSDLGMDSSSVFNAEEALLRGYRSKAVLPLMESGKASGILCVYSEKAEAFGTHETACLLELSKMLSQGIRTLEIQAENSRNREDLRLKDKALEMAASGIVILGSNLAIRYINRYALNLLGFENSGDFTGRSAEEYVRKTETAGETIHLLFSGKPWEGELNLQTADGSEIPVLASASPILTEEGDVEAIMVAFSDLRELKDAAAEVERGKILYEGIVETERDLVCRFLPDTTLTFVNSAYCEAFNSTQQELIGKRFADFLTPEEMSIVNDRVSRLTHRHPTEIYEHTIQLPEGKTAWFEWTDQGIFEPGGRLAEIQSTGRDVTDRHLAEEESRKRGTLFEGLFDNSPTTMFLVDPEKSRILRGNEAACRFYGYSREQFEGMPISTLNTFPQEGIRRILEDCLEEPRIVTLTHRLSNGTLREMEVATGPVEWEGKTVLHSIPRDVTERNQANRELHKRVELENLTSNILAFFAFCSKREEFNLAVEKGLGLLGCHSGVDRAYLFLLRDNLMDNTHEWCAPGVAPQKDNLKGIPSESLPWWMDELERKGFIHIRAVSQLPPEASAEKETLEAQDIHSLLVFAIRTGNRLAGFVGFDNIPEGEIDPRRDFPLLSHIAGILGKSLESIEALEKLAESEARYQNIVEKQTDMIIRFKPDLTITYCNEAYAQFHGGRPEDLVGHNFSIHHTREEIIRLQEYFATLSPETPVGSNEEEVITPDGSVYWHLWSDRAFFDVEGRIIEIQGVGRDITDLKKSQFEREIQQKRLLTLFENSPEGILECEDGIHISRVNRAFLDLFGYEEDEVIGKTPQQVLEAPGEAREIPMEEQIRRTLDGESLVTEGIRVGRNGKPVFVSMINLPRPGEKGVDGCYYSYRNLTSLKKQEEELRKNLQNLHQAFRQTVEVLSSTTEARDPYTAGHQRRVADLSVAIARRLGHDENFCEGLYLAAMVHDIGKIAIPSEILSKPSQLSDIERQLVRTHPDEAFAILNKVNFPWRLAEAALQHHERCDGSGYPNGLKGDEILPEARILAVADVMEAVSSHRPYRPALGTDTALNIITKGRGTLFDPSAVDACLAVFRDGYRLKEAASAR